MGAPLKIVLINKSDATGGAAVVSMRLLEALRQRGVDARMLVAEKCGESPYVERAATPMRLKRAFMTERLDILRSLYFRRENLWKVDTGAMGVPLWNHRWVVEADAVCLNWINQGFLSLAGVGKILRSGKPVLWTMHDMWCMTGVCHHAGTCDHYHEECGDCPLLGFAAGKSDLSHSVWKRKRELYTGHKNRIHFVPVSHWLEQRARLSSLLRDEPITVIPNAFPTGRDFEPRGEKPQRPVKIVMGAARLDDPVKGWPIMRRVTEYLAKAPAPGFELITYGNFKDPVSMQGIAIPHRHLGTIPSDHIRDVYREADIVVSTSLYETLPGTLVEGQAFGCVPVSFDRGGQRDIIDHELTGRLAQFDNDTDTAARNIAREIEAAAETMLNDRTRRLMYDSVRSRFSSQAVADAYIALIQSMLRKNR